eukprot:6181385-Pleurochrysis_carterae.AAC.2
MQIHGLDRTGWLRSVKLQQIRAVAIDPPGAELSMLVHSLGTSAHLSTDCVGRCETQAKLDLVCPSHGELSNGSLGRLLYSFANRR